jgi:hypothetical protein
MRVKKKKKEGKKKKLITEQTRANENERITIIFILNIGKRQDCCEHDEDERKRRNEKSY